MSNINVATYVYGNYYALDQGIPESNIFIIQKDNFIYHKHKASFCYKKEFKSKNFALKEFRKWKKYYDNYNCSISYCKRKDYIVNLDAFIFLDVGLESKHLMELDWFIDRKYFKYLDNGVIKSIHDLNINKAELKKYNYLFSQETIKRRNIDDFKDINFNFNRAEQLSLF